MNPPEIGMIKGKECGNLYKSYLNMGKEAAKWALSHQWINVEERLPDAKEKALCEMKSNGEVVSGYIFISEYGIPQVATDSSLEFADYENYEPIRWMKRPE